MRKTGGFAGVDESWQIAADGHITTSEGETGQVSTSDLNAAVEQLAAAGFFELQDFYVPQDTCCDRFTYQLTVTVDGKPHSVAILEAAPETPDQFWKALEVVNSIARQAVSEVILALPARGDGFHLHHHSGLVQRLILAFYSLRSHEH